MTTSSRIYKPTDWQLWMFTGAPGVFRLDFSSLNGTDVLGDTDEEGEMTVVDVPFSSITIMDGSQTYQGTFADITPSTASFTFQIQSFDKTDFVEFYSGKQIALTVKNQITNAAYKHLIYGYNTPYFIGKISDVSVSVDALSKFTTVIVSATENIGGVLNQPMEVRKTTTDLKKDLIANALGPLLVPVENWGSALIFGGGIDTHFGTTGIETKNVGEWLAELALSDVGFWASQFNANGLYFFSKNINFQTFPTEGSVAGIGRTRTIENDKIFGIEFGVDGFQNPTSYVIKTKNNNEFIFPASQYSTLSELISKELTLDILNFDEANANNYWRSLFSPEFTAIKISVLNAYENQEIVFDNLDWSAQAPALWRPITNADSGWRIILDLSEYGYSSSEDFIVTAKENEITKESWITHYYLTKGKKY